MKMWVAWQQRTHDCNDVHGSERMLTTAQIQGSMHCFDHTCSACDESAGTRRDMQTLSTDTVRKGTRVHMPETGSIYNAEIMLL